jgi:hypothetical protein
MKYSEVAREIDAISYKLESVKSIIELVAEGTQDNNHSSALWGCSELISVFTEKLYVLSGEMCMEIPKHESD